jgi:uncharacterized membrane protein
VLIYFIHHIATTIQLPHVIASIAGSLSSAIAADSTDERAGHADRAEKGPSVSEVNRRMLESGGIVSAPASGYLQFIRHDTLVRIASENGAIIRLHHRAGHFVVSGHPLASVWPSQAAGEVERELRRAHVAGPSRTLTQDVAFAVDQLVEIAIRALSPAVNDTFTALTCIDWLGESLSRVPAHWAPVRVHRDTQAYIRVVTVHISYPRLVERAFDKIRQAGRGMPAVMIRQLDALALLMTHAGSEERRRVLLRQAEMIQRAAAESVPETEDRAAVTRAFDALLRTSRP